MEEQWAEVFRWLVLGVVGLAILAVAGWIADALGRARERRIMKNRRNRW